MATQKPAPVPQNAKLSHDQMIKGIRRLEKCLEEAKSFDGGTIDPRDPNALVRPLALKIETALAETFPRESVEFARFRQAGDFTWPRSMYSPVSRQDVLTALEKCKTRSVQLLESAIQLLTDRLESQGEPAVASADAHTPPAKSNRIFLVHGHDDGSKQAVARFIEKLGYEPVILHEQANKGRTIIQKFQDEAADVGFAIVVMSDDDEIKDGSKRARQNVILELGFFLGRLGTENVVAIVKGDVERPSDFDGVVYIPFDAGWQFAVAKELEAAGYDFDWNALKGR